MKAAFSLNSGEVVKGVRRHGGTSYDRAILLYFCAICMPAARQNQAQEASCCQQLEAVIQRQQVLAGAYIQLRPPAASLKALMLGCVNTCSAKILVWHNRDQSFRLHLLLTLSSLTSARGLVTAASNSPTESKSPVTVISHVHTMVMSPF